MNEIYIYAVAFVATWLFMYHQEHGKPLFRENMIFGTAVLILFLIIFGLLKWTLC